MIESQRALIFVNGQLADDDAAHGLIRAGDWLVAADGGAKHLTRIGLMPHLLIGDLDSLSAEEVEGFEQAGVEIRRYSPAKDETDLELAIFAALARGCTELIIVGGLGGRLDQTLANLFLLALPELEGMSARLDDGLEEVFLIRSAGWVRGQPGDVVSLLPLGAPASGITTQGLAYPLRGETLYPERTRGISNVLSAEEARITLAHGVLICVHTRAAQTRP